MGEQTFFLSLKYIHFCINVESLVLKRILFSVFATIFKKIIVRLLLFFQYLKNVEIRPSYVFIKIPGTAG